MKVAKQILVALITLMNFSVSAGQEQQSATLPVGSAIVAEFKGEVSLRSPQGDALTAALPSHCPRKALLKLTKAAVFCSTSPTTPRFLSRRTAVWF
jgi:hypothetical protein